jgi:DNA-binding MarR family transcriptional regulator
MKQEKHLGRVGEERRKFELPCACANLRRATRAVTRLYDDELRETGLTSTQFTLLQVLERAPQIRQGKLGALLSADSTTLTRTLAPLVRKGWIKSVEGEDRRERRMVLTEAGRKQLERALPKWERAQTRLKAKLGEENWEQLGGLLNHVEAAAKAS